MQTTKYSLLIVFFVSMLFQNCLYEFKPNLKKYEDLLVVYGLITNEKGLHEIKLSRATSLNAYASPPISGATVLLFDDKGNSIQLNEKDEGSYLTPENFAGKIGTKYKITIALKSGDHYESDFAELVDVPEITCLNSEFGSKSATQTSNETFGYQFYVNMDAHNFKQKYYRWELSETWEIMMPYFVNRFITDDTTIIVEMPKKCWRTENIQDIYIANATEFLNNNIINFPINFTSIETDRLRKRYCLLVKQYALTEKSYYFWRGQITNTFEQGSLFNKQPYQVIGNIRNIDHPNEIVLGLFEASAVNYKRIFVSNPNMYVRNEFDDCEKTSLTDVQPAQWYRGVYVQETTLETFAILDSKCADCTLSNATPIMPSYWEE